MRGGGGSAYRTVPRAFVGSPMVKVHEIYTVKAQCGYVTWVHMGKITIFLRAVLVQIPDIMCNIPDTFEHIPEKKLNNKLYSLDTLTAL